ncbi:MAG: sel1 repeat family protein, partial [Gammaproteobacteria bacterium]|nr:sel1 repeat family protein [Gammaproteobacteria bacterium]
MAKPSSLQPMLSQALTPFTFALLLALYCTAGHADPLQQGYQAFERGDQARAITLWRQAADQGNAEAQLLYGKLLASGAAGLKQDPVTALTWYRKAAEQGRPDAQFELASALAA